MSTANPENQKTTSRGSFTIQKHSSNQRSDSVQASTGEQLRFDGPSAGIPGMQGEAGGKTAKESSQSSRTSTSTERVADPAALLDSVLLNISNASLPATTAREAFRQNLIAASKSIGACHLIRNESGRWQLDRQHGSGRLPEIDEFDDEFMAVCEKIFQGNGVQVQPLPELGAAIALMSPVRAAGVLPEILLVVSPNSAQVTNTIPLIQRVVTTMQAWLKSELAAGAGWQLTSLASITELVTKIETADTVKLACEEVANDLARELKCSHVAVGVLKKNKIRLTAVSGVHKLDRGSETSRNYLQALRESVTRRQAGVFPALGQENSHLLLSHKQLAAAVHNEAVYSQPLMTPAGKVIGAWLFTGKRDQLQDARFSRYVDTASPKVAGSIDLLQRAEKTRVQRALGWLRKKTSIFTRLMIPLGIVGFCLSMTVPVTYRVRCNCTAEPVSRRFAVAPFDGLVVSGFVEPGDYVKKDQVLAEIDGRSIRWELSGVTAERRQSVRQREIELAQGNISETFLAELENERLTAQEKILEFKRDHLEVKSPIDGVVLSGSLERAVAASITTGQVLFEIGPLQPMKIEIAVPASEIAQVEKGQPVKIWIEGQEDKPLSGEISRIHPRSEIRDAKNIFVAEIEVANLENQLRPGMKGTVRIDGRQRALGWCLFHKPADYLRSRLTWW